MRPCSAAQRSSAWTVRTCGKVSATRTASAALTATQRLGVTREDLAGRLGGGRTGGDEPLHEDQPGHVLVVVPPVPPGGAPAGRQPVATAPAAQRLGGHAQSGGRGSYAQRCCRTGRSPVDHAPIMRGVRRPGRWTHSLRECRSREPAPSPTARTAAVAPPPSGCPAGPRGTRAGPAGTGARGADGVMTWIASGRGPVWAMLAPIQHPPPQRERTIRPARHGHPADEPRAWKGPRSRTRHPDGVTGSAPSPDPEAVGRSCSP